MLQIQSFKFQLIPTGQQLRLMRCFAGSCRFVFNQALALQQANRELGGAHIGYLAMAKRLTVWRNSSETAWLKEAPVHPLQQALKDLEKAYKNFFEKRADLPRFKHKARNNSFRYPSPEQIKLDQDNSRVFLPKLGWLRYRNSRVVLGELRNVTVSLSGGRWFVSVQTRRAVQVSAVQGGAVGIDLGIARFATLSDGSHIDPLNSFKRHETALRKAQQAMSRKNRFSSNWMCAKARVQRLHVRIGNVRRDYLHKASTAISKNHAMVCIEELQVRNLSASAAGSSKVPGRNVRAKSGLNKAILDQGWFEFRRQLNYKLAWKGGSLIAVPAHYTSQTCPCCVHVSSDNRQSQAKFSCVMCGYSEHADLIGAMNILARGMQKLRDEEQGTADASVGWETAARIVCEVSGVTEPPAAETRRGGLARKG
ncbi:RNA-guided endonuclease TnpB family protein [Pseudomonas sp. NPDC008258]|uniref:RNA-guided endonuclease InsQ/TnpB family protein n=1 Tax=Pseudomonas sp. NPDC008258 TaxID=3364418 RepID=UPI0036E5905F